MRLTITKRMAACAVALAGAWGTAHAQDLKIGIVAPLSGPFASTGTQIVNGAKVYLAEHGNMLGGRHVTLIEKDDTGIAPSLSKQQAQKLIIQDKVDILAGFGLTPAAFAVAPLASQAKIPMVVLNAATSSITTKSPYIVRTSMTLPQVTAPMAQWAADNGIHNVYIAVADYGPGHDAAAQFKKTFTEAGGKIVGELHTPLTSPDFAPYMQKIKDAAPDAIFAFVPNGEQGVAFAKEYRERGLDEAGIKLLATGDVVTEDVLDAMGENAVGMITSFQYSDAHDSPENRAFVAAYGKAYPNIRPNMVAVAAYDGMRLIDEALRGVDGEVDGDAFMAAVKGMSWESPRGPIQIDPDTRDIIQNIYIRKVERVDGELRNVEFDTFEAVKDPGKA